MRNPFRRNPCEECIYFVKENGTCQSKKCVTGKEGYVTLLDRLWCEPCKWERKTNEQSK